MYWALGVLAVLLVVFVVTVHAFLTVSQPVKANVLIVEGWLSEGELQEALEEFRRGEYSLVVTTGAPLKGAASIEGGSYAERAAGILTRLGATSERLVPVPAAHTARDQSLATALVFRAWLEQAPLEVSGVNVFTSGVHGRRSRALYRRVLGPEVPVGVIAVAESRYDTRLWWISRTGIRKVARNLGGYLYYRCVRRP